MAQSSSTPVTQNRSPRTPTRENSEFERLSQSLNSTPGLQRNPAEWSRVRKKLPVPPDPEPVIEPTPEIETEPAIPDTDPNLSALTPMVADSPFFKVPLPPKAVKRPFRLKPRKMVVENPMLPKPPPIQREKRQRLMEIPDEPYEIADKDELEELYEKARYLTNWVPKMKSKKMIIEGDLLHQGNLMKLGKKNLNQPQDRWFTSRVLERIRPNLVITKGGPYVLEGKMSFQMALQHNLPQFIMTAFKDGFPESWDNLRPEWRKFILQQRENMDTMSVTASMTCLSEQSGFQPASQPKRQPSVIDSAEESEDDLVINRPKSKKRVREISASSDEENQPPNVMKVKVQVHRGMEKSNDISVSDTSLTQIIDKRTQKRKSNENNQEPIVVKRGRGRPKKAEASKSILHESLDILQRGDRSWGTRSTRQVSAEDQSKKISSKIATEDLIETLESPELSKKRKNRGKTVVESSESDDEIRYKLAKPKKKQSKDKKDPKQDKVEEPKKGAKSITNTKNTTKPGSDNEKDGSKVKSKPVTKSPKATKPSDEKKKSENKAEKPEKQTKSDKAAKSKMAKSKTDDPPSVETGSESDFKIEKKAKKHGKKDQNKAKMSDKEDESVEKIEAVLKVDLQKSPQTTKKNDKVAKKAEHDKNEKVQRRKSEPKDESKPNHKKSKLVGTKVEEKASKSKTDPKIDAKNAKKEKSDPKEKVQIGKGESKTTKKTKTDSKQKSGPASKPEDDPKKVKKAKAEETKKAKNDVKDKFKPKEDTKKTKKVKTPPYAAFKPKDVPKAKKAKAGAEKLKVSDLKSKPKNLKDLKKNEEILKAHNDNHEDNLFKSKKATKTTGKAKSKPQRASDILDDLFKDSDSEQNISLHSAKTPILAFIDRSRSANPEEDFDEDYDTG